MQQGRKEATKIQVAQKRAQFESPHSSRPQRKCDQSKNNRRNNGGLQCCTGSNKNDKTCKLGDLFGDPAYDINSIINYAEKLGIKTVIPPKPNRNFKRNFDSDLYCSRHIVENTFLKFKRWRGIATRYFKTFVAFCVVLFVRFPCLLLLFNFFVTTRFFLKLFSLKKFWLLLDKQKILVYH